MLVFYEGARSISDFISKAVQAEVERLENEYNNGEPFTPLEAGDVPQGRPLEK